MKRISTLVLTACFALAAFALNTPPPVRTVQVAETQQIAPRKALAEKALPAAAVQDIQKDLPVRALADQKIPAAAKAPRGEQVVNIEAEIASIEYYSSTKDWYIYCSQSDEAGNLKYAVRFDYLSDNATDPTGTYNTDDFDLEYSYLYIYDAEGNRSLVEYTEVTLTLTGDNKNGYELNAEFKGSDELTYKVHATRAALPEATSTINITATNLTFDDSYLSWFGVAFAMASNDTYEVMMSLSPQSYDYIGEEFPTTAVSVTLTEVATEEEIEVDIADALIATAREGKTTSLTGYILDWSGVRYNFDLSFTVPEPTSFVNIEFTDPTPISFYGTDYQWIAEGAATHEGAPEGYDIVAVYIDILTTDLVGEYTSDDIDLSYTMMGYMDSEGVNSTLMVDLAEVNNVKVTYDEATQYYNLTAELISRDAVQYNVKMFGRVGLLSGDASEGDVDRAFVDKDAVTIEPEDYTADYGFYAVYFDIETAEDMLALLFVVDKPDENFILPAGTYPINDTEEIGTVVASSGFGSSGSPTYSLYATIDGEYFDKLYFLVDGTVTVTHTDDLLHVTIDAVNSYDLPVKITYDEQPVTALDNTSADALQTRKFIAPDGQLRIIRGEHIYNATGTLLK